MMIIVIPVDTSFFWKYYNFHHYNDTILSLFSFILDSQPYKVYTVKKLNIPNNSFELFDLNKLRQI